MSLFPLSIEQIADHIKKLDKRSKILSVAVVAQAERIESLEEAMEQILDDMGDDGLCVCQAAKDQAIEAMEMKTPWRPPT